MGLCQKHQHLVQASRLRCRDSAPVLLKCGALKQRTDNDSTSQCPRDHGLRTLITANRLNADRCATAAIVQKTLPLLPQN
jgi:hypothetical protein